MSIETKKFSTLTLFILSPFLSLPLIVLAIKSHTKWGVYLLIGIMAFVSLIYLPGPLNDRTHYYFLYGLFKNFSLSSFLAFLNSKTDFIFYTLIFITTKLGISLNLLLGLILFWTLYNYYKSFFILGKSYNSGRFFSVFIFMILFSFQIKGLLSGIRFYFAASFLVRAFSLSLIKSKKIYIYFYFITGMLTHFSTAVFLPFFILFIFFKNKNKLSLFIFLFSFIFLFLPKEILLDSIISNLNVSDVYENKFYGYLGDEDYLENSKQLGNFNNYLRLIFNSLWLYVAYVYFLVFKNKNSIIKNMLLIILAGTNVFFNSPGIYYRLMFVPIIFFIFLLLRDYSVGIKNKKFILVVFTLLMINFFGNCYSIRSILGNSFFNIEVLTGPTMLMKEDISYDEIR